jgi:hypothetical protein
MDATQRKGSPKQLRGRSLGTKLSEAEYAQCEKSAARRGQTLSEWCRQALLDAVAGPAPRPEAEVILSEILVLQCSERRLPLDFRFSPAHRRPPKSHRS